LSDPYYAASSDETRMQACASILGAHDGMMQTLTCTSPGGNRQTPVGESRANTEINKRAPC
jgi:hypothetical protein